MTPELQQKSFANQHPARGETIVHSSYKDYRNYECLCQLEDGTIVPYDTAHNTDELVYNQKYFEFIGIGRIHSVDGVLQHYPPEQKWWFYRKVAM